MWSGSGCSAVFVVGRPSNAECGAGVWGAGRRDAGSGRCGSTIVHSKFGGQIFGFDIDQHGTEGVLSEAKTLDNGNVLAAVETFDEASGKILKVVAKTETQDNYLTLGIAGTSVGLVEREHVQGIYVVKRIYEELNPLDSNKFTGKWNAPLASDDIILGVVEPGFGDYGCACL